MAGSTSVGRRAPWRRWVVAASAAGLVGSGVLAPTVAQAADPTADLSVAVVHAPDSATAPADITFTVTASNAGPDAAQGVVVGLGYQFPLNIVELPEGCRRSVSYESVVCELGDLAAGASASVDLVLSARGSGLFTLPAAVASDTADPDAEDRVATDTLLVKPGTPQGVRYVRGVFPIILDRNPDQAATDYWAARWKAETQRYPQRLQRIPGGMIASNEYRRLRIRAAFQAILDRPADPASLESNVRRAAAGWTYQQIERSLITSPEFFRRAGVEYWTNDPALIDAIVQKVLGRHATEDEIARYTPMVGDARVPALQRFVQHLQSTTEARDRIIAEKYQDTFGRPPTALDRYVWLVRLAQGRTPESLWADLLVSWDVLKEYPPTIDEQIEEEYDVRVPAAPVQAAVDAAA